MARQTDPTNWEQLNMEEPIVRDVMAIERTIMANDRTFLAFWRTALTLFIAGLTFIQFFEERIIHVIGWIFIPSGSLVFLWGVRLYRRMCRVIREAEKAVQLEQTHRQSGCAS
jgi:putative membrane protein